MIDRAPDIANFYDGRVETCRVHDVMLEVLVSKSLESNSVSLIGGQYEGTCYDRIRRLSVHGGGEVAKESPSQKISAGRGSELPPLEAPLQEPLSPGSNEEQFEKSDSKESKYRTLAER